MTEKQIYISLYERERKKNKWFMQTVVITLSNYVSRCNYIWDWVKNKNKKKRYFSYEKSFCLFCRRKDNNTYEGSTWQIRFCLSKHVDGTQTYTLRIALATAHFSELQVRHILFVLMQINKLLFFFFSLLIFWQMHSNWKVLWYGTIV